MARSPIPGYGSLICPAFRSDLYEYFVNLRHPLLEPLFRQIFQAGEGSTHLLSRSFLGYTVLILIAIGFVRPGSRRKMTPWLILLAPFLILRLGDFLTVGGRQYLDVPLPKHFLDTLVPGVFEGFHTSDHFQIGLLFPLAVLACFGAQTLQQVFSARHFQALVLLCIALVAFEYYQPVLPRIIPKEQFTFLEALKDEPDNVRIINAPSGRGNSKNYLLYQSLSSFPQAEGLISRTPSAAYDYIRANAILDQWHRNREVICSNEYLNGFGMSEALYLAALDQLEKDGFSHVVFHPSLGHGFSIRKSFHPAQPFYSDDNVSIYRLDDLRASCPSQAQS